MAESHDIQLGMQIGRLTEAVEALTNRLDALEKDMKGIQGIFSNGKWMAVGAVGAILLIANGFVATFKQIKELLS